MLKPTLICGLLFLANSLLAQLSPPSIEADNLSNILLGQLNCESGLCRPGVRNRSQSRGVVIRYERQGGFNWSMNNAELQGEEQRVSTLEQFTFKFKVPIVNKPGFKMLLGFEWDTEKYFFEDVPPIEVGQLPNMWQLLDERRLKATKLSAYFSKSWDDKIYSSARLRLSLSGDYDGLVNFGEDYRTYSGGLAIGKKVSDNKEWGVGLTFSTNKARTVAIPFFIYNITWNDHWGLEAALPGQVFLRHNICPITQQTILFGARFDSRYYAINSLGDKGRYEDFGRFFLRTNGIRTQVHYERRLIPWVFAYAQGGMFFALNARFNAIDNISLDLQTNTQTRPFFRIGLFVAPPKELIR